jgi:hypothetical protein
MFFRQLLTFTQNLKRKMGLLTNCVLFVNKVKKALISQFSRVWNDGNFISLKFKIVFFGVEKSKLVEMYFLDDKF